MKTIDGCGTSLFLHGKVSRNIVLDFMMHTNFTVLLRSPTLRYAKAGFPSKVIESMATGTPVICNITSDLSDFLCDGDNSIIVKGCTASDFKDAISRALQLSYEDLNRLSYNARMTIESRFDYRLFVESFADFIRR